MTGVDLDELQRLLGPAASPCRRTLSGERGISLPPFLDHHVHLHLIDSRALIRGGIAGVVDLGGDPVALARRPRDGMPHVAYAGAFLTAAGGYPSGRPWAPDAIVRVVASGSLVPGLPGGARTCVDEQADAGASVIKVALNSAAGPVMDPEVLSGIVSAAHDRGLPVVAHVEGDGMTLRALEAGVDVLAHAPFSERLDPAPVARASAAGQAWISTLAVPGADTSVSVPNLADFAARGGRVLYGTDLGNGDREPGVSVDELQLLDAAGVRGPRLIASLTDPWPLDHGMSGIATFVAGPPPRDEDTLPEWLGGARVVPEEELVHHGP